MNIHIVNLEKLAIFLKIGAIERRHRVDNKKNLRASKKLREPHLLQDLGCLPDQPSTVILNPVKTGNEVLTENRQHEA